MTHKLKSRFLGEISITSDMQMWHHPYGRMRRRIKEPFDESERGEWKSWLKAQHSENEDHGIRSHHFLANRWGEMEITADFIFLSSKITVDGNYSHEIKRHLLLERKTMTDIVLKSRDHFANKGLYSQSYSFSSSHVWMGELDHNEGCWCCCC